MNRPRGVRHGAISAARERLLAVTCQSERTLMLGTILLVSVVSMATGYILTQCYGVDVLTSFLFPPEDCWGDWGMNIGRHCFSDYGTVVKVQMRPNPWEPYPLLPPSPPVLMPYPAAALLPHLLFGLPATWLGAPRLGLIGYMGALTIAVLSPAVWAARGTRGLERVVVFAALSAAAIPAWMVIDRGNSAGFVVPIALVFLVALRRRRWGLVTMMVILAALLKPQFAVLAVALFAARQWRRGGLALAGAAVSNLAAYLLWPRDFPETIPQSIHNILFTNSFSYPGLTDFRNNVSFGRALLQIPDRVKLSQMGKIPDGYLAGPRSLIGYSILGLVVVFVLALGRRISPVMVGIALLATATLSSPMALCYYLVFVLPIAALVARDPGGPPGAGVFDDLAACGGRRRAVGVCVSLAVALTIAQVPLPGTNGQIQITGLTAIVPIVGTTVFLAPFLWLLACAAIIVSYTRRPACRQGSDDQEPAREDPPDTAVSTSSYTSELTTESSSHGSP